MYQQEAAQLVANLSPKQAATGELMVLKNTIKKFVAAPEKGQLMRFANSELGRVCCGANSGNINRMRESFQSMVHLVKSGRIQNFKEAVIRAKTEF